MSPHWIFSMPDLFDLLIVGLLFHKTKFKYIKRNFCLFVLYSNSEKIWVGKFLANQLLWQCSMCTSVPVPKEGFSLYFTILISCFVFFVLFFVFADFLPNKYLPFSLPNEALTHSSLLAWLYSTVSGSRKIFQVTCIYEILLSPPSSYFWSTTT